MVCVFVADRIIFRSLRTGFSLCAGYGGTLFSLGVHLLIVCVFLFSSRARSWLHVVLAKSVRLAVETRLLVGSVRVCAPMAFARAFLSPGALCLGDTPAEFDLRHYAHGLLRVWVQTPRCQWKLGWCFHGVFLFACLVQMWVYFVCLSPGGVGGPLHCLRRACLWWAQQKLRVGGGGFF